ncbi:hypothetical protein LCGC14_1314620 [marine sediment metagenome]|uniref:Uncharacterized protein n=1 Tax=marine sediment metagenome TaxID=412755 RepID=A0A0F9NNQ8_9ZZZZ
MKTLFFFYMVLKAGVPFGEPTIMQFEVPAAVCKTDQTMYAGPIGNLPGYSAIRAVWCE